MIDENLNIAIHLKKILILVPANTTKKVMDPKDANPKNFKVEKILYTSPQGFSIAKGEWTEDEMNRFAMRWNGDLNDSEDKGYPSVLGHPMWFQLPYDIKDILKTLIENSGPMTM